MSLRYLTALPVYNEASHVTDVLNEVRRHSQSVLVVDDGSTDGTSDVLAARRDIAVIRHRQNRGYGAALRTEFQYAIDRRYDVLVTIDCDGQHEPRRIPLFVDEAECADIVSGSRYLHAFRGDSMPPADRRRINQLITAELNELLGLSLTDAFCGFKAYRVEVLRMFRLVENGYAMPLELWVQAARMGCKIVEVPVPLIYLDEHRSLGGSLDDATARLAHYRDVIQRSLAALGTSREETRAANCGGACRP